MIKIKYLATQRQILLLAACVQYLPLREFLEAIDLAETVGPIVDPTLYIRGVKNMDQIKRLAEGARSFQIEVEKVIREIQA